MFSLPASSPLCPPLSLAARPRSLRDGHRHVVHLVETRVRKEIQLWLLRQQHLEEPVRKRTTQNASRTGSTATPLFTSPVFVCLTLQVPGLTGGLQGHGYRPTDDAGVEGQADPGVQSGEEARGTPLNWAPSLCVSWSSVVVGKHARQQCCRAKLRQREEASAQARLHPPQFLEARFLTWCFTGWSWDATFLDALKLLIGFTLTHPLIPS